MSGPRKPSLRAALGPVFARRDDRAAKERLRLVVLLFGAEHRLPDATAERIADVLADGQPRTETEIAKEIKRRRTMVAGTLRRDRRFVRAAAPPGRSTRARTWALAFQGEGQVGTSGFGEARRAS